VARAREAMVLVIGGRLGFRGPAAARKGEVDCPGWLQWRAAQGFKLRPYVELVSHGKEGGFVLN